MYRLELLLDLVFSVCVWFIVLVTVFPMPTAVLELVVTFCQPQSITLHCLLVQYC